MVTSARRSNSRSAKGLVANRDEPGRLALARSPWWESAVLYQIYPLSFADGNGDGTGDLRGIIEHLDYLGAEGLGIDGIWLSPVNCSPMQDNGYDVSDYYNIDPIFGTLADFDELIAATQDRGLKLIMDLVINHTSSQHDWFLQSASSRDNPQSDWYIWRDPGPDGGLPNNWLSYFGGPAWTWHEARQQYYYHAFNRNQPDLNWRNPLVRRAIGDVLRFWCDRGVDGFRLDASSVYAKDVEFRDNPWKLGANSPNPYNNQHHLYDKNLPENHAILRELRQLVDTYGDRLLIGETFIDSNVAESNAFYGTHHDEVHLPFNFEFTFSPWHPGYIQREIQQREQLTPIGDWPTYFWDNHDIPRHLSRWAGPESNPTAIAQAAATILLTLRGTPVLYYGQEIGMVDHDRIPPEQLRDAVFVAAADQIPETRDGVRTPMQWNASPQAGFSHHAHTWLPLHPNYQQLNVAAQQADRASLWHFYRSLLHLRKFQSKALRLGSWQPLIDYPDRYLAYLRQWENEQVLVLINFEAKPQILQLDQPVARCDWTVRLTNSAQNPVGDRIDRPTQLEPQAIWILQRFE
jgi:alpha-glucosidase